MNNAHGFSGYMTRRQVDYRIASVRGATEQVILAEEEAAVTRSIAYCRGVLRLLSPPKEPRT